MDGEIRKPQKWCLAVNWSGSQTFCEGEFLGYGESACEFQTKESEKGGITCVSCLQKIREIKNIKL